MASNHKVALVHDYLREYGDAEKVLEALHRLYPEAPVYTAFMDRQGLGADLERFAGWEIRTTPAQRLPQITRHYQAFRGLLPYLWESLDFSEFDLVVSSSGPYMSQTILTRPATLHVSYCHTPPLYLWEPNQPQSRGWLRQWTETWLNKNLRQYDFYAAQRVDRFVTTSQVVAKRMRKFYRRAVEVIPPPVTVQGRGEAGGHYYLYVGPLTREQQVELAVDACTQLDRPLWVVGTGSDADRLQRMAGPSIRFLGAVPEAERVQLYAQAKALLFPCSHADFAITPVEAMGAGIPVIASKLSGMREVILDYRTGLLFEEATVESLGAAIAKFEGLRFSSQACIERAEEFAESVFASKLEWFIAQSLDDHRLVPPMNA